MIAFGRHRPLIQIPWDEAAVRVAIDDIAADAIAQFDPDNFWPAHPSDDGTADGDPSFYKGAAGVIWSWTTCTVSVRQAVRRTSAPCCRG